MLNKVVEVNNTQVEIQQDLSLSHAGTVWDGALVLIYFFQKHPQIIAQYVRQKRVLELGSGTGVLGLCLSTFGPSQMVLSDLEQYLSILNQNYILNKKVIPKQSQIKIMGLKWGNKEDMERIGQIDCIVGSQLAYDSENITMLLQTLHFFMKKKATMMAFISYQKYPQKERNLRIRIDETQYFTVKEVQWEQMDEDYRDEGIGILLISLKQQN